MAAELHDPEVERDLGGEFDPDVRAPVLMEQVAIDIEHGGDADREAVERRVRALGKGGPACEASAMIEIRTWLGGQTRRIGSTPYLLLTPSGFQFASESLGFD